MRAPPRPRFQRPRTQLVHLLLDVQPPARVAARRPDSIVYSARGVGIAGGNSILIWQVLPKDEV